MPQAFVERLMLGTAQLGAPYGIANRSGPPNPAQSLEFLKLAFQGGIRQLDTAPAYGESEARIGAFHLGTANDRFEIFTKIRKDVELTSPTALEKSLRVSIATVQAPLAGVLLHNSAVLDRWNSKIDAAMDHCVQAGLTKYFGVSVYTPEEFAKALERPRLSCIQAPFNLLDTRLSEAGLLAKAAAAGKAVVLRSLFLQGLLLMSEAEIPARLVVAQPWVMRLEALCKEFSLSRVRIAAGYALTKCPSARFVVGAERSDQLTEIMQAFAAGPLTDARLIADLDSFKGAPPDLIDPRQWARA